MQTDAQIKGLLLATTMPIRRFDWHVLENGAKPDVVDHIAESFNLPIHGQDPVPRRNRNRFSHDRHLAHSLRALTFGHFHFERVYEYRDPAEGGDGLLHLAKLATRPPRTISNFLLNPDGSLKAIEQDASLIGLGPGGLATALGGTVLDASRLLSFVWDSEDDGDQVGRSILRACFREWLIKDRLIRVDATKHERNAMGIPWFEILPGAGQDEIDSLALAAEKMRAGEQSGGAGPGKLKIAGVEGNLPDTIGSIRYHDQQMSRAFLLLFFELGTSETGSRSLGSEFIDWYVEAQGATADWYVDAMQAQIEDEVTINYGPEEQPPMLGYTRLETAELAFADLATAVEKKLIAVDDELRSYISQRWKLPKLKEAPPPPVPPPFVPGAPPPVAAPPTPTEGEPPPSEAPRPGAAAVPGETPRARLAGRLIAACTGPTTWPNLARAAGSDAKNGTARRARDELLAAGALIREGEQIRPAFGLQLPDRELRRNPYRHEVAARVDYAAMDAAYRILRQSLVEAYKAAQAAQIDALAADVAASDGDTNRLSRLSVMPISTSVLKPHLEAAAQAGVDAALSERDAQLGPQARGPLSAAAPAPDEAAVTEKVNQIASAAANTLAAGLSFAASKRAVAVSGLPPDQAAAKVHEYLSGLSDATLTTELGGATMHSYGTGRQEFIRAQAPTAVYASELLDDNTCGPCGDVDGAEYPGIEASEGDYPFGGGYIECEGGLRCRGTIVAQYGEPRAPTDAPVAPELPTMPEAPVPPGFSPVEVSGQAFHDAIAPVIADRRTGVFLSDYSAGDYAGMRTFLADQGRIGGALKRAEDGTTEIVSLFNRGGERGGGSKMLGFLNGRGGKRLDAIGDDLRGIYEKGGWKVTQTIPWDDKYAPAGWDYAAKGRPNIYVMEKAPVPRSEGIPKAKPDQPVSSLDGLYKLAATEDQAYNELLDVGKGLSVQLKARELHETSLPVFEREAGNLVAEPGIPVVAIPPQKLRASAAEKIAQKLKEGKAYSAAQLTDVNRASILVDKLDEVAPTFNELRDYVEAKGWKLTDFDDHLVEGKKAVALGYRDLSVNMVSPEGYVTEVQIHINPMWTAKFREGGHDLYDEIKATAARIQEAGVGSRADWEERNLLRSRSEDLYGRAWAKALGQESKAGWTDVNPLYVRADLLDNVGEAVDEAQANVLAVHDWPTPFKRESRLTFDDVPRPRAANAAYIPGEDTVWINTQVGLTDLQMVSSTTHELGHRLDDLLGRLAGNWPPGASTYSTDPGVRSVLDAIAQTDVTKRVGQAAVDGICSPEWARYAVQERELFARAYARYIAEKAGRRDLLDTLNEKVWVPPVERYLRPSDIGEEYTEAEFAPIAAAFDKMLRDKGWLK